MARRWIWGTLAKWFVQMHIAREIKPETAKIGGTREQALQVMQDRMRVHFDAAWPETEGGL